MEPVNKKSLDREIAPTFENKSEEDSEVEEAADSQTPSDEPSTETEEKDGKPRFGRRRRRASSSGVVTA